MGRGQQMSICDIEKWGASSTGTDLGSLNKRKLVSGSLLVAFVPLVITCYYTYYTTPNALFGASSFFQRRPFSSFLPLKEDTIIPSFIGDTNGSDTQVEPKIEDTDITPGSLGGSPPEFSPEPDAAVEDEKAKDSSPKIEDIKNITDHLGTSPLEEKAEAGAIVEDEDAKEVAISETDTSANEKSVTLGSLEQEQENLTRAELKHSTSPDVSGAKIANDASKQIPDDSSNVQQSEPSIIAMEGQTNTTTLGNTGVCDLVKGSWVPDPRPPRYTNATCNSIQPYQNCMTNGRPDTGYLYWKWQPDQCDLPGIDARAFLTAMRDRSMAFVGDSIARNQFQSLLCLLSQVDQPKLVYKLFDDRDKVHVFPAYNFTMAIYWSPYLMHVEEKEITFSDNSTESVPQIHLDKLDKAWVDRVSGVDLLQISSGQWWFKRCLYLQGGQPVGGHMCGGWESKCKEIEYADEYAVAVRNFLQGILSLPGYTGTTVLRTFSPDHFEDGEWYSGGKCVRTTPGGMPIRYSNSLMYEVQKKVFQNVTDALSASEKQRIKLLDITSLAQIRSDGHPDAYMNFQPYSKEFKGKIQKDCLHWCLPGPIDTWNDLLVASLHDAIHL